jgi:hypothetical protein
MPIGGLVALLCAVALALGVSACGGSGDRGTIGTAALGSQGNAAAKAQSSHPGQTAADDGDSGNRATKDKGVGAGRQRGSSGAGQQRGDSDDSAGSGQGGGSRLPARVQEPIRLSAGHEQRARLRGSFADSDKTLRHTNQAAAAKQPATGH